MWNCAAFVPTQPVQVHLAMAIPNNCTLTILRHFIIIYLAQECEARNKNEEMSKRLLYQLEVMKETITTQAQRAGANSGKLKEFLFEAS